VTVKDFFKELVSWIRESLKPVLVIFAISATILFWPTHWATAMGMAEDFHKYRFFGLLGFVGACVWLLVHVIEMVYHSERRRKHFKNLRPDEKEVLRHFIENHKTTQAFSRSNLAIARELAKSKILIESNTLEHNVHPYFLMDKWTFNYLSKRRGLVGL
jgi:Super-infection exclusion protein B